MDIKGLLVILTFIVIVNVIDITYGQGQKAFVYTDADRRNPFIPLVTEDGRLNVGYGVIKNIDEIVLEGIIYDPSGNSVAIMNDIVFKENDKIGKIEVKKIQKDKVILYFGGKDYILKLKE